MGQDHCWERIVEIGQRFIRTTERTMSENIRAMSEVQAASVDRCNPSLQGFFPRLDNVIRSVARKAIEKHIIWSLKPGRGGYEDIFWSKYGESGNEGKEA